MSDQTTFASLAWTGKKKVTRRERFLAEMEAAIPWARLIALIEPHYPTSGRGRPSMPIERMLRIHFLQLWFNLSDPAAEDALYDSESMRRFAGLELGEDAVPDESTILRFRHLLERHQIGERILSEANTHLEEAGLVIKEGTLVDATLIAAASSTKNRDRTRDPEMRSTKKGNQWYFGMKVHVGTDPNGIVHSLRVTDAASADITQLPYLIHGAEDVLYGDKAYWCEGDREDLEAAGIRYRITRRAKRGTPLTERQKAANRGRSKIRAAVEHPFGVAKHLWGHGKVRYRGLAKNASHFYTTFALVNLYRMRKWLAPQGA